MTGLTYKDNFSRVFDYTDTIEAFVIPKNATMLHIWAIGAGGNGGAGFSRAAGNPGGGGGGGASGAIVTMLIPTKVLPDVLYVQVGKGGGVNTDGWSRVMLRMSSSINIVIDSLLVALAGNNGNNGTASGTAGGGSVQTYSLPNNLYAGLGITTTPGGQAGSSGGTASGINGQVLTVFNTTGLPFTGGTGGAGCTSADFSGGSIIPNSNAQQQLGITLAGGVAGGGNGLNGLQFEEPLVGYGGTGGGSNNTGVAGNGGNGAIGCGGGGGGAGVTGGTGGLGGNGRVVITWF